MQKTHNANGGMTLADLQLVFESPVLGLMKDWGPDWTGPI